MRLWHKIIVAPCALFVAGLLFALMPPLGLTPQHRPLPALSTATTPLNITVFGTSLSAGPGWPDDLGQALETCLKRPVNISRIARPGGGSGWGLTRLADVLATQPDLLILEFAINDADLRDGVWLKTSVGQHQQLILKLRTMAPQTQVLLMTTNPAYGLRGLLRPRLRAYYQSYRRLAATLDTGLADVYGHWLAADKSLRRFPDGLHPTDGAAKAVILPVLLPMIASALDQSCEQNETLLHPANL